MGASYTEICRWTKAELKITHAYIIDHNIVQHSIMYKLWLPTQTLVPQPMYMYLQTSVSQITLNLVKHEE